MEKIKNKTDKLLQSVEKAIEWSDLNNDEVVKNGLKKPFKSIRRNLSVIQQSLEKRPSIAIFGQSQVGKSYLVQNLAKPFGSKYLKIKIAKGIEDVNFLTDMNPDGGKESTGLVTRFTTQEIPEDKDYPFEVDFFNQLDIAAILINGYWSDLKDFDNSIYEFDYEEIKSLWNDLSADKAQLGVSEDEAYFFQEYIKEHFKDSPLIRDLNKLGYFSDITVKLPQIPYDQRWKVLHYLWGQNKFFTQLFKKLSEGIKELNFEKNARVDLTALTPQSQTILDVERIREILDKQNNDFLNLKLPDGQIKRVLRSVISILTKEVQLQLSEKFQEDEPQSFLNHSDLLDFPGSKSREKIPLAVFDNNTAEQKLQLLIRGKVSYLFDSYTNKLGVSTLLYCMDNHPPEEKEAPNRLFKWIEKYVGKNKENRTETLSKTKDLLKGVKENVNEVSPLLVAFTKFNVEINKVLPGKETNIETHNSKWQARFKENFLSFMSRPVEDKWLTNWTKEEGNFQFVFPIRDPLYSQPTFEGFDSEGIEKRIRPERKEAMQAIETSFTNAKIVNDHTLSSTTIWDELCSPNGTGIQFLSKHLQNSAHPIVTETRLALELEKIQNELLGILTPYQISGNLSEDLKAAKKKGALAFTSLIRLANKKESPLSQILSELVISDTELWNLLYDLIFGNKLNSTSNEEENADINIIDSFQDMGIVLQPGMSNAEVWEQLENIYAGLEKDEIEEVINDLLGVHIDHIPSLLTPNDANSKAEGKIAELMIAYWIEKLMSKTLDENALYNSTSKEKEIFRTLLAEIIKGRERFNLNGVISDYIKDIKSGSISSEDIDLVASCSATILNKFLFSAGWAFAEENQKPKEVQTNSAIFSEFGTEQQTITLDYSENNNKHFFKRWSLGVKELFAENVKYSYNLADKQINTTANQKLDTIIKELQPN